VARALGSREKAKIQPDVSNEPKSPRPGLVPKNLYLDELDQLKDDLSRLTPYLEVEAPRRDKSSLHIGNPSNDIIVDEPTNLDLLRNSEKSTITCTMFRRLRGLKLDGDVPDIPDEDIGPPVIWRRTHRSISEGTTFTKDSGYETEDQGSKYWDI
jgi:hypothetical protein